MAQSWNRVWTLLLVVAVVDFVLLRLGVLDPQTKLIVVLNEGFALVGTLAAAVLLVRAWMNRGTSGYRSTPMSSGYPVAPAATKPSGRQSSFGGTPPPPPTVNAPAPMPRPDPMPQQTPSAGPSSGLFDLDLEAEAADEAEPEEVAPAKKGGLGSAIIDGVTDVIERLTGRDEETAPEPESRDGQKRRESEVTDDAKPEMADEPMLEDGFGGDLDDDVMEGVIPRIVGSAPDMPELSLAEAESAPPSDATADGDGAGTEEAKKEEAEEELAADSVKAKQAEEVQFGDHPQPISAPGQGEGQDDPVQFSAYYPREIQAETRYGLYVYAHLEALKEAVSKDVAKFKDELGGAVEKPKVAKQTPRLKRGTVVTVTPECEELTFDPPSLTKTWQGDWTRYGFDFRPGAAQVDETLFVRVSVQVGGIEIAHIRCALDVVAVAAQPQVEPPSPENPLAAALLQVQQAALYEKIFVSYSRRDKVVVENYRLAQIARGDDVFMDTYSIRTGENWQAALANAIAEADIFQLFWSENSAGSENVKDEWEYAMTYRCPDNKCAAFIRPVYWVNPWPPPPAELGHLNFRFVPLKELSE